MQRFSEPLFTPTRKSKSDEPLPYQDVARDHPKETALVLTVFRRGAVFLAERGITLIDGKNEVSEDMLVDEWLTGDCCRMTWSHFVQEGVEPPWLDKELVRQEAMRLWAGGRKFRSCSRTNSSRRRCRPITKRSKLSPARRSLPSRRILRLTA